MTAQGTGKGIWKDAYEKAQQFVDRLTLEEKVNVTRGFAADNVCAGNTGTIPRLGWPGLCLHDAGNGVRATDFVNSYPSALHVGASWDKNLTYQRGYYMGKEFKAKGGEYQHLGWISHTEHGQSMSFLVQMLGLWEEHLLADETGRVSRLIRT